MVNITNPFSRYRVTGGWRKGHYAIDYGMDVGTPILAPADGTVTELKTWSDAGKRLVLTLDDGRKMYFCHLSSYVAKKGQRVPQGALLAKSGNTGKTTGPHLHTFGTNKNGTRWNWTLSVGNRITVGNGLHVRKEPHVQSEVVKTLAGGVSFDAKGWLYGSSVSGNSIWLAVDGGYVWSGGTTTKDSTSGLKNLNPAPIHTQVTTTALHLREKPSASSKSLGVMPAGTVVSTTRGSGDWDAVTWGSKKGYAHISFMVWRDRKTTAALNMRTGPSTKDKVITVLPVGTKVTIHKVSGKDDTSDWAYVTAGSHTGWVSRDFLK